MTTNEPVIHSDPDILGGTPVFVGTRVPVRRFDYLSAGETLEEFLTTFRPSREPGCRGAGTGERDLVPFASQVESALGSIRGGDVVEVGAVDQETRKKSSACKNSCFLASLAMDFPVCLQRAKAAAKVTLAAD